MFSTISEEQFLQRYWQQRSLVLRNAFGDMENVVNGDELAGLACEEVVESRIVRGSELDGEWTSQSGPFTDFDYDSLGASNWTLLVQGLDQWDDKIRSLLDRFDFLPVWRLEDVMASFAPVGGGVGPHFDYYDVFLIQASGQRRWQTGQMCDDRSELQNNASLKLLSEFTQAEQFDLDVGDCLYVPAGMAHWGTSLSNDCVTLSVGFRAPSDRELLLEASEILSTTLPDSLRYRDDSKVGEEDRFSIETRARSYVDSVIKRLGDGLLQEALVEAFGRLVTDTRNLSFKDEIEAFNTNRLRARLADQEVLSVVRPAHCRMAHSHTHLFVNGEAYPASPEFSKLLCEGVVSASCHDQELEIVARLLNDDMIRID